LKQSTRSTGYMRVSLYKDGKKKTHDVHRLVGLHFIPNPESKFAIDHIDRDKTNNHVSNLRWATTSENCQNKGKPSTNTSGHKNIYWGSSYSTWVYRKEIRGKHKQRRFKSKTDALCYKFIMLLLNNNSQSDLRAPAN